MRNSYLAAAASLLIARQIRAWDMFVSITPGHGTLASTESATASTLNTTMITPLVATATFDVPSPVLGVQAECTHSGLTNHCMPLYTAAPHNSDASTTTVAKGFENLQLFLAFGASLFLLSTGRLPTAVLLLMLLVAARATAAATTTETRVLTTTTIDNGSMPVMTPLSLSPVQKAQCYSTLNGLAFNAPCSTAWVYAPSPTVVTAPGQACYVGGTVVPCADVGVGRSSAPSRAYDAIARTATVQASCMAFLFADRLLARPLMVLCLAMSVYAEPVVATSAATTTAGDNESVHLRDAPTLAPAPTAVNEKWTYCYATSGGLALPSTCPAGYAPPPPPSPTLQPGQCTRDGLVYQCGATYWSLANHSTLGQRLLPYTLPLLGYQLGLINGKWLMILWGTTAALNAGVRATPQTGPMVTLTSTSTRTNTITVFYATPPPTGAVPLAATPIAITATVTTLAPAAKGREADACPTSYGMQNCPLPYSSPVSTGGAARLRPLGFGGLHALWPVLAARRAFAQPTKASSLPMPTLGTHDTLASTAVANETAAAAQADKATKPKEGWHPGFCLALCGSAAVTRGLSPRTMYALWALLAAQQVFAEPVESSSPPMATLETNVTTAPALSAASKACAGFYGPQQCPASSTAPVVSATYTSNPNGGNILVPGSGAMLLRRVSARTFYALGALLFARHALAEPAKQVSIPLPELAVNTTTTASVTFTQLVFVQNPSVRFTPTVTKYIALCTPHCGRFDKQGRCTKIEGCGTTATTSGSVEQLARSPTLATCLVLMFAFGLVVGRIRRA